MDIERTICVSARTHTHTHTLCVHIRVNSHRLKVTDGVNLQPQIGCLADSQAQNDLK